MSFGCQECEKSFETEKGLKIHFSRVHQPKNEKINKSDKSQIKVQTKENVGDSSIQNASDKHRNKSNQTEKYNERCVKDTTRPKPAGKTSTTGYQEENHYDTCGSGARPKTSTLQAPPFENMAYVCECCDKSFATEKGKKIHVSSKHRKNDPFPKSDNPTERVRRDKEKDKGSKDDSEILNHKHVTEYEKPPPSLKAKAYFCEYCDKSFDTEKGKKIHVSSKHKKNGDMFPNKSHPPEPVRRDSLKEDRRLVTVKIKHDTNTMHLDNNIPQEEVSQAASEMEKILSGVMSELRNLTPDLRWKSFNSGSYYDKTKNAHADEFDIMIYPDDIQADVDYSDTGVTGFFKVKMTSPRVNECLKNMVDADRYVNPSLFKEFVFILFDKVFESTGHKEFRRIKRKEKSDDSSPAYTVIYNSIPGHPIDIDLVPCFRIDKWPPIARSINPEWISKDKVVNDAVKCFDVVCKTCPEKVPDWPLLWRMSFSYAEKKLITYANDGSTYSSKKRVFRAMKSYVQSIKDNNPDVVKKFCSYHIKQFMLHQYDEWDESTEIAKIQRLVLERLIDTLSKSDPFIDNYFLPKDNVIQFVPKREITLIVKHLEKEAKKLQTKI